MWEEGGAGVASRNPWFAFSETPKASTPSTPHPYFLSITVNKANGGPLLRPLIYYFNDSIAHCLAIVSLMTLIKLVLIKAGDI